ELSAVLIEHLCVNVFDGVYAGRGAPDTSAARALEHARWFVEEHYRPFPLPFEAALADLRARVDTEPLVRLSPVLFRVRARELEVPVSRRDRFHAAFSSLLAPRGALSRVQEELVRQLEVV